MKFLIVIFYLMNGEPRGADLIGPAPTEAACIDRGAQVLEANKVLFSRLLENGITPQVRCLPMPEFGAVKPSELAQ